MKRLNILSSIIHIVYLSSHVLAVKGLRIGWEFANALRYGYPLYFDDLAHSMLYVGAYEVIAILVIIYDLHRENWD